MRNTSRPASDATAEASAPDTAAKSAVQESGNTSVNMTVNGHARTIMVEARMTLLEALREELALTGTKMGRDRGECGACTVHVEGRRILSCMTLAVMQEGKRITTIEGLERDGKLHPVQAAFIEHDGFQCGFCTCFPPEQKPNIFVCGSTPLVEDVSKLLVELGHDPLTVKTERFGPSGG